MPGQTILQGEDEIGDIGCAVGTGPCALGGLVNSRGYRLGVIPAKWLSHALTAFR